MSQLSFAAAGFVHQQHKTRREMLLGRMEGLIPCQRLATTVARYYANSGSPRGRPA